MSHHPRAPDPAGQLLSALTARLAVRGILVIAALSLVCNMLSLVVPFYNMQVFNRVLPTRDAGTLAMLVIGMVVGLAVWGVLDVLRTLAMEALAGRLQRQLALPLLNVVASNGRGGGAVSEALSDLETVRAFVASADCTAPFDAMWAPVLLMVLLLQHWAYAVMSAVSCVMLVAMNVIGDIASRRQMMAANEASAAALRHIADTVGAADAVQGLGMLPALTRRWEQTNAQAGSLVHRATMRARAVSAIGATLRMAMTGGMVALGLVLAINGLASGGSMVAGNMILARLLMPFQQFAGTRRHWIDAIAAWRRIRVALENPMPVRYETKMPVPRARLVVERLVYMLPNADRPLLRGVSFIAEAGDMIGIIGPSSSGKSTLVRLIMGMVQPSGGGVFLDGSSTFLWEREDFAVHCGYVPQSLALLGETVAMNVARMRTPDTAAVLQAAKRANVHRTIAKLPHGYATVITGGMLSSGQRQRLALARALYHRPGLLILDEPTSFLDHDGEADLAALLVSLRAEGTTVLVVTHRPSLLENVDKVLVLEDGAVSMFGPRQQVLRAVTQPSVRMERAGQTRPAVIEAVS